MKYGKLLILLTLVILAGSWVNQVAGDLTEAKKLLADGKYSQVDTALKDILAEKNVDTEVLKLSLTAAIKSGKMVTAEMRIKALMRSNGKVDADLSHQGAVIAYLNGDRSLALARYLAFVDNCKPSDKRLKPALWYLLKNGAYPSQYKQYVKLFGANMDAWQAGKKLLDRLVEIPDGEGILDISAFMMKNFRHPEQITYIHRRLWEAAEGFQLGKDDQSRYLAPVKIILASAPPSNTTYMNFFCYSRIISRKMVFAHRVVTMIYQMQAMTNAPLDSRLMSKLATMSDIDSAIARADAGKKYLAIESIYKNHPDPAQYKRWLDILLRCPTVFNAKEKPLVSGEEMRQKFAALAKMFTNRPGELADTMRYVRTQYFTDDDQAITFLNAHKSQIHTDDFIYMMKIAKGEKLNNILAKVLKGRSLSQSLDYKWRILSTFVKAGQQDDALQIAKDYIYVHPGDFSTSHLVNNILNSTSITLASREKFLTQMAKRMGSCHVFALVLKQLSQGRKGSWQQSQALTDAKKLASSGKITDLATSAHIGLSELLSRSNAKKHVEVMRILRKVIANWGKTVPCGLGDAKDLEIIKMANLWQKHLAVASRRNRKAEVSELIDIWLPVLGSGEDWIQLASLAGKLDRSRLHAIAKRYASVAKGSAGNRDMWQMLSSVIHPKDDLSPLSKHYADMTAAYACEYVRQNAMTAWSDQPAIVMNELGKIAKLDSADMFRFTTAQEILDLVSPLVSEKTPASANLIDAIWKAIVSSEIANGNYEPVREVSVYSLYLRSGHSKLVRGHLAKYHQLLASRHIGEQIEAHNALRSLLPREATGKEIVRNGRLGYLFSTIKPLLVKAANSDLARLSIDYTIIRDLRDISQQWPDGKDKANASETLTIVMRLILSGATASSTYAYATNFDQMDKICIDAVENNRWPEASGYLNRYSELFKHDANWARTLDDHIKPLLNILEKNQHYESAHLLLRGVLRNASVSTGIEKQLAVIRGRVARHLPSVIPVPNTDPTYDLHLAGIELSAGSTERAWDLTKDKIDLIATNWESLDPHYVLWSIKQMQKQKLLTKGLGLCFTVLLQEAQLPADLAGEISLLKGDIYTSMQNYQAARIEYESLINSVRYRKTIAGLKGRFRLVEVHLATRDYAPAETMLERLTNAGDLPTQAEAYYLLAKMAYLRGEYTQAKELLKKVTSRVLNHVEAALLAGEINLKLKHLANPEIEFGTIELSTVLIPGRILTLKIQDLNLAIARGGSSIPIVLKTSKGGDIESISLVPDSTNKTIFKGTIATGLGKVKVNNLTLEVLGDDVVTYTIDEAFQKANDISYAPKTLYVRSNGKLTASAGEILSEIDAQRRELERRSMLFSKRPRTSDRSVRPGSDVYVQVTDFDRDISDEIDTITVDLDTTSGDILEKFVLKETATHSGIFKGAVPTNLPLPRGSASDSDPLCDPNGMINTTKPQAWKSLADGMKPKWAEVDLMSSASIKSVRINVPNANAVKRLRLMGTLAGDGEELASFPSNAASGSDGIHVEIALGANRSGGTSSEGIGKYLRFARTATYRQDGVELKSISKSIPSGQVFSARMTGTFYSPASRFLEVKFARSAKNSRGRYRYLFIDGERVLASGGRGRSAETCRVYLAKGAHKFVLMVTGRASKEAESVSYRNDKSQYVKIDADWFSVKKFPALEEYIKPKATIRIDGDSFIATLNEPMRLRRLRWIFDDFSGNSVSVSKFMIVDAKDTVVVPTDNDFSSGLGNRILEVSPGDNVQVTYRDEQNLRGTPAQLTSKLGSSFYNGQIEAVCELITTDAAWRRRVELLPAKRCVQGDSLIIMVTDYDQDTTDKRDTLDVMVTTSGGEILTLKALETSQTGRTDLTAKAELTHAHAGVFMAVVNFGDTTTKDTIKITDGQKVTISYLDRENTDPGIPFMRSYSLTEAGAGQPEMLVYRTNIRLVEDTSELAKSKIKRFASDTGGDAAVIMKRQIVARHSQEIPASLNTLAVNPLAPLLFEVNYPKIARHSGSRLNVTATAQSEIVAAKKEGREPTALNIATKIEGIVSLARQKGYQIELRSDVPKDAELMLNAGSFAGVIRLQIGGIGDAVDNIVSTTTSRFNAPDKDIEQDPDIYTVPTLIVTGSDTIHLTITDEKTGEILATKDIKLASDAQLELLERSYSIQSSAIYLGERLFVRVTDPDSDTSDLRDIVPINVTSKSGDILTIDLTETIPHSGIFTGSIKPVFIGLDKQDGSVVKTVNIKDRQLEVNFGDTIQIVYTDISRLTTTASETITADTKIHYGTDAKVTMFSKRFRDAEMAVRTRLLMAEALFEKAKQDRIMKKPVLAAEGINKARKLLAEAIRDCPNTSLAGQGEFLLANLAQEAGRYDEALGRYSQVISSWGESEYAPRSQLKKAICYEKMGNYDQSCEEYVKLTYIYPDSELVSKATIRLAQYYYRKERFDVASKIFYSFQQSNPSHELAAKCLFFSAQCSLKQENFIAAAETFAVLCETYKEDKDLRAESMFRQGKALFDAGTSTEDRKGDRTALVKAYQVLKQLTWDYPESKWAKLARGILTNEVFTAVEESLEE